MSWKPIVDILEVVFFPLGSVRAYFAAFTACQALS